MSRLLFEDGNPIIDLAVLPDPGGGNLKSFDRDIWGRVSASREIEITGKSGEISVDRGDASGINGFLLLPDGVSKLLLPDAVSFLIITEYGPFISLGIVRGSAVLIGGTITVAQTSITVNSLIFLSRTITGGTEGHLSSTLTAGVDFTINSSDGADTSTVAWLILEP